MTTTRQPDKRKLLITTITDMGNNTQLLPAEIYKRLDKAYEEYQDIGKEASDDNGTTPLMRAAQMTNVHAVKWLLDEKRHPHSKPDVFALDNNKMSALMYSVSRRDLAEDIKPTDGWTERHEISRQITDLIMRESFATCKWGFNDPYSKFPQILQTASIAIHNQNFYLASSFLRAHSVMISLQEQHAFLNFYLNLAVTTRSLGLVDWILKGISSSERDSLEIAKNLSQALSTGDIAIAQLFLKYFTITLSFGELLSQWEKNGLLDIEKINFVLDISKEEKITFSESQCINTSVLTPLFKYYKVHPQFKRVGLIILNTLINERRVPLKEFALNEAFALNDPDVIEILKNTTIQYEEYRGNYFFDKKKSDISLLKKNMWKYPNFVKQLVNAGIVSPTEKIEGIRPLNRALLFYTHDKNLREAVFQVIKILVEYKAEAHNKDLELVIEANDIDMLKYMLIYLNGTALLKNQNRPLQKAAELGNVPMITFLLEKSQSNTQIGLALEKAVKGGHIEAVKRLLFAAKGVFSDKIYKLLDPGKQTLNPEALRVYHFLDAVRSIQKMRLDDIEKETSTETDTDACQASISLEGLTEKDQCDLYLLFSISTVTDEKSKESKEFKVSEESAKIAALVIDEKIRKKALDPSYISFPSVVADAFNQEPLKSVANAHIPSAPLQLLVSHPVNTDYVDPVKVEPELVEASAPPLQPISMRLFVPPEIKKETPTLKPNDQENTDVKFHTENVNDNAMPAVPLQDLTKAVTPDLPKTYLKVESKQTTTQRSTNSLDSKFEPDQVAKASDLKSNSPLIANALLNSKKHKNKLHKEMKRTTALLRFTDHVDFFDSEKGGADLRMQIEKFCLAKLNKDVRTATAVAEHESITPIEQVKTVLKLNL